MWKVKILLCTGGVCWCVCVALACACISCGGGRSVDGNSLVVSIEPLRFLVEEIVGDDFPVTVLVPPGASPETYEPTPLQIRAAEDAQLVFSTGLIGFETVMLQRLPAPERVVDLSAGIELVVGRSDPHSGHGSDDADGRDHDEAHVRDLGLDLDLACGHERDLDLGSGHDHVGADPHIWMAPRALATMARTAYERIHEHWPDSTSYTVNYKRLAERLTALDREVSEQIASSLARSFMIFHPGLTYYARDYGLHQIAIESGGKEPSARQLAAIVTLAQVEGVSKILYQSEFPRRTVEVVAAEIGAEPVEIGVLSYDVIGNILKITDLITRSNPTKGYGEKSDNKRTE